MTDIGKNALLTGILTILASSSMAQIQYNEADWGLHPMPYNRVGTAGFQFLKIPSTARITALGNVTTAFGFGDAASSLSNPASTADVSNFDVMFTNMEYVADISFQSFALVKSFGNLGTIGFNYVGVNYGVMERTEYAQVVDATGNTLDLPVTSGLGTFSAYDRAVGITYARRLSDKLQLGGNLRYIEEKLDDAKTSAVILDVGTLYYTGYKTLRFSMIGKFFGPDAEFREYAERIEDNPHQIKMPMMFAAGAAMDLIGGKSGARQRLTAGAEFTHQNDGDKKLNLGFEYELLNEFALRAGYRFNYDEFGFTLGGGLKWTRGNKGIRIDYALMDAGRFKTLNMFTISSSL